MAAPGTEFSMQQTVPEEEEEEDDDDQRRASERSSGYLSLGFEQRLKIDQHLGAKRAPSLFGD
jgi:hypothetical protein